MPFRSMTTRRCWGTERGLAGPDARARYLGVGSGMPPDFLEGSTFLSLFAAPFGILLILSLEMCLGG